MPGFLNNINLNKFELQNPKIHNLASAPASPAAGQIYFNTADGNLYVWDSVGSAWVDLTVQGGGAVNATTTSLGYVQLAGDLGGTGTAAAAPIITAGAIDAGKINANLKPSGTAAAATEALRALGATASTALAGNTTLNAIAAPVASVNLNSQKLIGVLDPTAAQDGATKNYVDNAVSGLDAKASVRAMTTANILITNPGTAVFDGITLSTGDRLLVANQTAQAENGIYIFQGSASALTRATDADLWTELPGAYVWVESGTANADTGWVSTVDPGGTLNTTAITFTQFAASTTTQAGNGLTKTGNTLSVLLNGGAASGLVTAAGGLNIGAAAVTNAMLAGSIDLTTKVTGTLPLGNGGTGQTTAKLARETGLTAAGYYSAANNPAATTWSITQATHGLRSTRGLLVQVSDETSGNVEIPDISVAATGDVTITFGVAQTLNAKRVTIVG